MEIRSEQPGDIAAIHRLNVEAFDTPAEAQLVDTLRQKATPCVSLVAEDCGIIVGHILFTPVSLNDHVNLRIMGLAPMAVARECQRKGIGSLLVTTGLQHCKQMGYGAVVVLGHPDYYPRFGFDRGSHFGINSEYNVPDEGFMVVELDRHYLAGSSGTIRYHPAFAAV